MKLPRSILVCTGCPTTTTRLEWRGQGWRRSERTLCNDRREVRYTCPACQLPKAKT
jgi:hypothetical protein